MSLWRQIGGLPPSESQIAEKSEEINQLRGLLETMASDHDEVQARYEQEIQELNESMLSCTTQNQEQ